MAIVLLSTKKNPGSGGGEGAGSPRQPLAHHAMAGSSWQQTRPWDFLTTPGTLAWRGWEGGQLCWLDPPWGVGGGPARYWARAGWFPKP